ncbi:hypothetical protein DM860_010796 [Cuscuta australis]|uniref:Protein kinase domain-containing protein n=1 Tax=Cuscuta australis TaxID=267555 RepID=A0A328DZW9_9ASTE|nr:hypothetical protein DM860_010796 [Cuscuta australis]
MADSGVEAVLGFLKKYGLALSESALMEDILERSSRFGSLLPMVPPPLKIPANRWPDEAPGGVPGSSNRSSSSSDDEEEFISLGGSSTTDLCSSEFTNPYGIRCNTYPSSQASSSDRLSQFGTARDQEFDMQDDIFWYGEKDEDYDMPPDFKGSDFAGVPSEDKFVTTLGSGRSHDDIREDTKEDNFPEDSDHFFCKTVGKSEDYRCSSPLCACCCGAGVVYQEDLNDYGIVDVKLTDVKDFLHEQCEERKSCEYGSFNSPVKEDSTYNYYKPIEAADKEGSLVSDELQMYDTCEDDFEVFNLKIIHRKNRTGFEENKDIPIVLNSIIAGRYYVTEYLGSAAFSKVVQARDLRAGMDVCLKIIKNDKDFFDQSLDEIKLLKFVNKHDPGDERHILRLYDYFYYQEHLFIVCELLRADLYEFQKYNRESETEPYFTISKLKAITRQCLVALEFLHSLGIIHCDVKPENILIKSFKKCEIKVIDLGSSCFETDDLSLYVQSRSYRAPEVILGLPYDHRIDIWSLGCVLAELCTGKVLFPNEAIAVLLARVIGVLGPFDMDMLLKGRETHKYFTKEFDLYLMNEETNRLEYLIPEETSLEEQLQVSDPLFIDFVRKLLQMNPKRRPTASEALRHPWLFSHQ